MRVLDTRAYTEALLAAERPGAEKYLAFYDHRIGSICKDPSLLLIPLDDHLCHRGDGLFESLVFRERTIFGLAAHIRRMQQGSAQLHIEPPCSWDSVQEICVEVARAAGEDNGALRVFLSRGPGGFGISPRECSMPGLYVVALKESPAAQSRYMQGVTAFTSTIPPKQDYMVRIKSTNYLPNVLMAAEADALGFDVAVSFNAQGSMCEAAVANIALILDGSFVTPRQGQILEGTTLLCAREIMSERMPIKEMNVRHEDLFAAEEVLLLTSSSLCVSVTHFDGTALGSSAHVGKPGPLSLWLKDALYERLKSQGTVF